MDIIIPIIGIIGAIISMVAFAVLYDLVSSRTDIDGIPFFVSMAGALIVVMIFVQIADFAKSPGNKKIDQKSRTESAIRDLRRQSEYAEKKAYEALNKGDSENVRLWSEKALKYRERIDELERQQTAP